MHFKDRFETIHFIESKKIVAIIRAKEGGSFWMQLKP